jgi:hypothetical protein
LSDWSSYYPSGEETKALLEGNDGTYEVRVRARDTGNAGSGFSNRLSVEFTDAPPYPPETPTGDTLVFARASAEFSTRSGDSEGDDICFRFDPGDGEPYSDWSALQSQYYDYDFSYAYPEAGIFGLRAQCKDENGNVSAWSACLTVHVLENLRLVGSCTVPGGAEEVTCDGQYAYLSTLGSGLQIADVSNPSAPQVIGGSGTFDSSEICRNLEAAFLLSVYAFDALLHAYDVSAPGAPLLLGEIGIEYGGTLDVQGEYALVGTTWFERTVVLIDVAHPDTMSVLSTVAVNEAVSGVVLDYPHAYVVETVVGTGTLRVIEFDSPSSPRIVGTLELGSYGPVCLGPEGYVYVATRGYYPWLKAINVEDPGNPHIESETGLSGDAADIHCSASRLSIAYNTGGVELFDVSAPPSPVMIGTASIPGMCKGVWCGSQYLCVARGGDGLFVYSYPSGRGRPRSSALRPLVGESPPEVSRLPRVSFLQRSSEGVR